MQFSTRAKIRLSQLLGVITTLALLLVVACGSAAAPEPGSAPAEVPEPMTSSDTAPVATATPVPQADLASTEVHPGRVTWMVGSFANERMTYCLAGGGGHDYGRQIHAFLIDSGVRDGARVIMPGVATKWEISPDGKSWTLDIREGVKFHNGQELTVEDVLWTLQWAIGEQAAEYSTGGGCLSGSQITESFEQTGPNQVRVNYKTVKIDFEDDLGAAASTWTGTIYPAGLGEGPSVLHDEAVELAFDRNPIGAGAFTLKRHVASELMEMERFDDHYWQPANGFEEDRRAKFTTLDLRLVPEQSTRVAAVRAGEADIAPVNLGAREQIEAGGGRIMWGQEGAFFFARLLGCWEEHLPCHDIRVRQALNYAIDRISIRDQIYGGPDAFQAKGFVSVTPSTIGYSPKVDPFLYDPEKAQQLMAEAGYKTPNNPSGKDFGKLIINTWPSAAVPNMPDSAQYVAELWNEVLGIDTEVRVSEESSVKKVTRLTEEAYGQVLFRDNETKLDAQGMLHGTYGRNPDRPDRASRDPDVVALATEIRQIIDPEVAAPRIADFYVRARDESNEMMIGYVNIPWAVGPRIATWEPWPLAFYVNSVHTITIAE